MRAHNCVLLPDHDGKQGLILNLAQSDIHAVGRRALNGPYHPSSFPHCMTVSQSWVPDGLCWKTSIQYSTPNPWACCVQRWTRTDTAGFSRHNTGPSGGRRVLEGLQDSPGLLRQRVALPEPGRHLQHSRLHGLQQRSALHHLRAHGLCRLESSAPKAGVIYFYSSIGTAPSASHQAALT